MSGLSEGFETLNDPTDAVAVAEKQANIEPARVLPLVEGWRSEQYGEGTLAVCAKLRRVRVGRGKPQAQDFLLMLARPYRQSREVPTTDDPRVVRDLNLACSEEGNQGGDLAVLVGVRELAQIPQGVCERVWLTVVWLQPLDQLGAVQEPTERSIFLWCVRRPDSAHRRRPGRRRSETCVCRLARLRWRQRAPPLRSQVRYGGCHDIAEGGAQAWFVEVARRAVDRALTVLWVDLADPDCVGLLLLKDKIDVSLEGFCVLPCAHRLGVRVGEIETELPIAIPPAAPLG